MTKALILVHTAIMNPGQTREGWLKTMVGDPLTGQAGRIIRALQMGTMLTGCGLYIPVAPQQLDPAKSTDRLPEEFTEALKLVSREWQAFGLDREQALELLGTAHVDWWEGVPSSQINTAGEARRAIEHAKLYGFNMLCPVSTGYGHAARAVQTVFAAAAKEGLAVWGCADTPFEGLDGQLAAIVDPPHVADAPFLREAGETQPHELVTDIFKTCKADKAKYKQVWNMLQTTLARLKAA
ncbi:MAG TPA: hypothetical protein VHP58_03140 [Alphaproteobacteria bacterium]|nr:hypothetical protein [Alphaproteobacteria bacterium]